MNNETNSQRFSRQRREIREANSARGNVFSPREDSPSAPPVWTRKRLGKGIVAVLRDGEKVANIYKTAYGWEGRHKTAKAAVEAIARANGGGVVK